MKKKLLFSLIGGLVVFTLAVPALAASSDFLIQAQEAYSKYCTKLNSPLNQALGCYAFEKTQELQNQLGAQEITNNDQNTQIASLNSSVADLQSNDSSQSSQIIDLQNINADLESRIVTLENQNTSGFPAPNFDSGWIELPPKNNVIDVIHNLGGDVDNYYVDVSWKREAGDILSHQTAADSVWWSDLSPEGIKLVTNGDQSNLFIAARVRIWKTNPLVDSPFYFFRVPTNGTEKKIKINTPGTYRIIARNQYQWGYHPDRTIADPEWMFYSDEFSGWKEAWTTEGFSLDNDNLDLQIDGEFVNWAGKQSDGTFVEHEYSPAHQYQIIKYISDEISFKLYDTDYHDNSGEIEVVLYRL